MKIINNLKSNHYDSINQIIKGSDEFLLVSPFLLEDFDEFIHNIAKQGVKKIILITTLKDNSADLFKKANSLYSFCLASTMNGLEFEVRIDNKLHGKIYVAIKEKKPVCGIITSANFTDNGLSYSHEWGILINEVNELQDIINDLFDNSSLPLSALKIEEIVKIIDNYQRENKVEEAKKPKIEVSKILKYKDNKTSLQTETDIKYFIKPVGSSEAPFIHTERQLNRNIEELHFSKRRPASVRPGDILICYAVGTTKLLGYFEVLTEPKIVRGDESRWPWGVDAKNLCPEYSDNWHKYDNTLSTVQSSYGEEEPLTFVGGKTLGALNFGADKIQLKPKFARFIIEVIERTVKS